MTYCAALKVDSGLVFVSDSRTNAGVDQLSTYSKVFTFGVPGERAFAILTAGNLATTQAVINQCHKDIRGGVLPNLYSVSGIHEAAEYLGQVSLSQQRKHLTTSAGATLDTSASLILGGQILGHAPEIFLIYPEGNFIAATNENPYLQIGEVKYGKPILDRIINRATSLEEAALCALVSMDSTMRSNATVGPPIDVVIYSRDSLRFDRCTTFSGDAPYLIQLRAAWEQKLKEAFSSLPRFDWINAPSGAVCEEIQDSKDPGAVINPGPFDPNAG